MIPVTSIPSPLPAIHQLLPLTRPPSSPLPPPTCDSSCFRSETWFCWLLSCWLSISLSLIISTLSTFQEFCLSLNSFSTWDLWTKFTMLTQEATPWPHSVLQFHVPRGPIMCPTVLFCALIPCALRPDVPFLCAPSHVPPNPCVHGPISCVLIYMFYGPIQIPCAPWPYPMCPIANSMWFMAPFRNSQFHAPRGPISHVPIPYVSWPHPTVPNPVFLLLLQSFGFRHSHTYLSEVVFDSTSSRFFFSFWSCVYKQSMHTLIPGFRLAEKILWRF